MSRTSHQTVEKASDKTPLAIAALAVAGAGASVSLTQHYYDLRSGAAAFKSFCNLGSAMNCDVVAASRHAELFAGLPISSFAAGWFLALFVVALIARNVFWRREAARALAFMTGVGLLFSLSYLWIMVGVLKTFCLYCLVVDGIALLSFGLALALKPEGFSRHKPEADKWKTFAGIAAASLLVSVVVLKSMEANAVPSSMIEEMAASSLSSPVLSVGAGPELPSIGPADAPVTIVEFSDFQCPHCRNGAQIMHSVQQRFPGQVRVVFRNFPLDSGCNRKVERSMHPYACEAARAAVCSHKQGKFEPVYEALFENQARLAPGKVTQLAQEAGTDAAALAACLSSQEASLAVSRDVEEGLRLDIQSTPTFFINGHKVEGALPPPVWARMIDELLKNAKK